MVGVLALHLTAEEPPALGRFGVNRDTCLQAKQEWAGARNRLHAQPNLRSQPGVRTLTLRVNAARPQALFRPGRSGSRRGGVLESVPERRSGRPSAAPAPLDESVDATMAQGS